MAYFTPESRLAEVRAQLAAGKDIEPLTVRTLLHWFGASRRGSYVVSNIEKILSSAGLQTLPDFNSVHIDSEIRLQLRTPTAEKELTSAPPTVPSSASPSPVLRARPEKGPVLISGAVADPAIRVGRLASANSKPLSVTPDCTLSEAVTLMLGHDFSQLPVMTSERDVKGVISWESIGSRLGLKKPVETVRDCMRQHHEVLFNESLFTAISQSVEHSYVLVRGQDRAISGIVTTSDLSLQFQQLSEPFLLLSEIENHVRLLIDGKFTVEELACEPAWNIDQVRGVIGVQN